MSAARKKAAIKKANNETDRANQMLMLTEHHYDMLKAMSFGLAKKCEELQAKIDALMLEYCPDEMTKEQLANWEAHQRCAK